MGFHTERLRHGIRSGVIRCGCRHRVAAIIKFDYHFSNCPWMHAVNGIYTRERAEELARLTTTTNEATSMRFTNETTDQVRVVQRKHAHGDEPDHNYVLLPGDSCEIPGGGSYEVTDHGFRPINDEEAALVKARDGAPVSAPAPVVPANSPFVPTPEQVAADLDADINKMLSPSTGGVVGGPDSARPDGLDAHIEMEKQAHAAQREKDMAGGILIPGSENLPEGAKITSAEMDLATGVVTDLSTSEPQPVDLELEADMALDGPVTGEDEAQPVITTNLINGEALAPVQGDFGDPAIPEQSNDQVAAAGAP